MCRFKALEFFPGVLKYKIRVCKYEKVKSSFFYNSYQVGERIFFAWRKAAMTPVDLPLVGANWRVFFVTPGRLFPVVLIADTKRSGNYTCRFSPVKLIF